MHVRLSPFITRRSLEGGLVELRQGPNAEHASRWLQVSHAFQPSVPRLDVQLEQTTVSLAFSLEGDAPSQQQVYAFLPLRSYGLTFIVQVRTCNVEGCVMDATVLSASMEPVRRGSQSAAGVHLPAPQKLRSHLHCPGESL